MIEISKLNPSSPEIDTCAKWRVETFDVLGGSLEKERSALRAFTLDPSKGLALVARVDGALSGTCLLVPSEIEPLHDVTPWLAGLYVTPKQRRRGVGAALVRAIESNARTRGVSRLHLYTTDKADFYARLGWTAHDRVDWMGFRTTLMVRDL